jgi:hypothetical protein
MQRASGNIILCCCRTVAWQSLTVKASLPSTWLDLREIKEAAGCR